MVRSPPQHMPPDSIRTHMFHETYGFHRHLDVPRPPAEGIGGAIPGRPAGEPAPDPFRGAGRASSASIPSPAGRTLHVRSRGH